MLLVELYVTTDTVAPSLPLATTFALVIVAPEKAGLILSFKYALVRYHEPSPTQFSADNDWRAGLSRCGCRGRCRSRRRRRYVINFRERRASSNASIGRCYRVSSRC